MPYGGLRAALILSRIVHNDSDIFRYGVESAFKVRHPFRQARVYPQDVRYRSDTNALTVSGPNLFFFPDSQGLELG